MKDGNLFTKDAIWLMDSDIFQKSFLQKQAVVRVKNGIIEGRISEIGLSSNINIDTNENLPVSIKIRGRNISITDIESIELL